MWYIINNIEKFVESSRVLVYNMFGEENANMEELNLDINNLTSENFKEINNCLTQKESMVMVFEFVRPIAGKKNIFKITEQKYIQYMDSLNSRLVSNILSKLTVDGVLESAFDEESNDFVFWSKDSELDDDKKS